MHAAVHLACVVAEDAQLEDVKNFFFKHYTPCNAILVVAGPVQTADVKALAEKWFGDIPSMGVFGAALGTGIAQLVLALLLFTAFLRRKYQIKYNSPYQPIYGPFNVRQLFFR